MKVSMTSSKIKNILIVVLSIVLFVYTVLFVNSLMNNEKVGFFNMRFYIMPRDSQEIGYNEGDLVIARTIKPEKLQQNDTVLYRKDNLIYVDKILDIDTSNSTVNLSIKKNNQLSKEDVENVKVIGKVLGRIERIGNVAIFIQSPLGTLNVALLIICLILIIRKAIGKREKDAKDGNEI